MNKYVQVFVTMITSPGHVLMETEFLTDQIVASTINVSTLPLCGSNVKRDLGSASTHQCVFR